MKVTATGHPVLRTNKYRKGDWLSQKPYGTLKMAEMGDMSSFDAEMAEDEETSEIFGSKANRRAKRKIRQAKRGQRRGARDARRASGNTFGDRLRRGIQNFSDSGIAQSLGNLARGGGMNQAGMNQPMAFNQPMMPPPPFEEPRRGLSTGAKVAIGLAVVAVVGGGIYMATKKK